MKRAANQALRGAWAWLAWAALLMLVAQPVSAAVMAQPQGQALVVEICSDHSPGKSIAMQIPGDPAQKAECGKCPNCLSAPTVVEPPAPATLARTVAYHGVAFAADHHIDASLARESPRPPGQGPPSA